MQIESLFPFATNLNPKSVRLLELVMFAHSQAAYDNPNASTAAAVNSYFGSKSISQAICSAILATGKVHGPVTDARMLLDSVSPTQFASDLLNSNQKVPGFGNSFYKNSQDPAWAFVEETVRSEFESANQIINSLSLLLMVHKKAHIPNAAMWTAVAASECGFPVGTEPSIFIVARIGSWVKKALE